MKKKHGGFSNLVYLVRPYWQYGKMYLLGRIAIEVFVAPALALLQVRLVQSIIDAISAGAAMETAIMTAAAIVSAIFILTVLRWSFLLLYDRWKVVDIQNKLNRSIYEKAISTDYKYFDNPDFYNSYTFAIGELATRSESALQLLTQILGIVSVAAAMTAYLSALGPWVIIISVVGQAVCIFAQRKMQKLGILKTTEALPFDRKLQYVHRVAYQRQYAADMKATDLPHKILALFDKSVKGKIGVFKKLAVPNWRWNMLQFSTWHFCQFAQLAYMIFSIFARNLGIGIIAGMFAAADRLNNCLNQFVSISAKSMEVSLYAEKIREFFDFQSDIEPHGTGVTSHGTDIKPSDSGIPSRSTGLSPRGTGIVQRSISVAPPYGPFAPATGAFAVDVRDASFAYPGSDFALRGINISAKPGEKIAIVGENGAGKTTLAKLLMRLYDMDSGDIIYDGVHIRGYNVRELRRKIGVAFQEPQLYALTARENMTMYNPADDAALRGALCKAGLGIGLDSEITREFSSDGVILSGGQAQKLALARLLHGEFGLLLLDEPSSALDPLAEYEMTKLIFTQSNTTTIMVAHRLSTIRDAHRIYLMAGGRVAESGTHDELMSIGGIYAEMFHKQAENYVI